jgi:Arc/MetJ-type ribon-helix-helix transcriptional regulator
MKQKISISIEQEKIDLIEDLLKRNSRFRNKSHFIEYSLDKTLEEETKND